MSPIYCVLEILKSLEKAKEEAIPSSGKDWEPVFEAARRQGLSAPLYHRLKETGGLEKMPADLRKKAHSDYLRNAARNMRVYHELGKILRRCDEAGLPVIVLKGAHLAQTVYENIALRTFGDLDLLVRETDLGKIDGLLSRERYVRTEASLEATPAAHHFLYRHKTVGLTIELHWRLFDSQFPANIGTEELFSRADEVVIAGQPAYVMESIDEVLYLCVHAAKHTFDNRLRGLYDIDRVIATRREFIDWPGLAERARAWRAIRSVFLTLRLCRAFFETEIPDETMVRLVPADFDDKYLAFAVENIADPKVGRGKMPTHDLTVFWGERKLIPKAIFLLKKLFPSPGYIAHSFPVSPNSILVGFFYPLHFLRMLGNKRSSLGRLARSLVTRAPKEGRETRTAAFWDWLRSG